MPGSLILIKTYYKDQYYYVVNCSNRKEDDTFNGYRVNRDFTVNAHDKKKEVSRTFSYALGDEITLIDPVPPAFLESLRTLHFWVESIIDDLGAIVKSKYTKELLRPVQFENGSYGIIRNRFLSDGSLDKICSNAFEDLSYDVLINRWEKLKKNDGYDWVEYFDIDFVL